MIISAGQASISSSVPVGAAEKAAEAAGWEVDVYDNQLNPANAEGLVRQAIASGADGIILQAIGCPGVKGPLQEAKAKGIQVVGLYAFDGDDPIFGGSDPCPCSAVSINYGADAQAGIGQFTEKYGADQAKAVIAATGGKAKVIFFNSGPIVLQYTGKGFLDELKKCAECEVVAEINFAGAELGPNLQQKGHLGTAAAPGRNVVKSPTPPPRCRAAPAVKQSGRADDISVMGGEGFAPELDLLRTNQGVNAVNIAPSDWTGWAVVDIMNSLFAGTEPVDSGLGWQLVDKDNSQPASGPFVPDVDFKSIDKCCSWATRRST